ncbi:DNA-dependent metalloprotease SPRTN [Lucilia cuprina]|uniref:DNA-dependent metalloprotease SPRTN n=1 Tax=Lucilia cuprina TaxID=7375 RepID=UPI001F06019A|nr:DNA-dependent metalloprotease SPRTN [Lucilia cuprina]
MSHDTDYLFALEMQRRMNAEAGEGDSDIEEIDFKKPSPNLVVSKKPLQIKRSNPHSNLDEDFLNRTQNLVHPQWETLDPTPDIFALFGQFDTKFFQSRLKCVTLEWSKRMYSCAGICYSRRNRYGMDITIRLSQPLLSLRPRKDLVETMLHEMIHAYCFVLNIREGNGGHGPNFKKIMGAINKVAGTNITVYHTFHDEVELYKQHWWRCNGICQDRSPFFGYVKRTSNRAPGPNDQWWATHLQNCGGTFMKIKEPEKKKKGRAAKDKENDKKPSAPAGNDLRKFFTPQTKSTAPPKSGSNSSTLANIKGFNNFNNGFKGPVKTNGGGTMLLNPKTKTSTTTNTKQPATSDIAKAFPPSSYPGLSTDPFNVSTSLATSSSGRNNNLTRGAVVPPGGNLRNVMGFRDLGGLGSGNSNGNSGRPVSGVKPTTTSREDWGRGSTLTSSSYGTSNTSISSSPEGEVDRKHLRDIWSKRFGNNTAGNDSGKGSGGFGDKRISNNNEKSQGDSKRRRISTESRDTHDIFVADEKSSSNKKDWIVVDDDIMLQEQTNKVITLSSDDEDDSDSECITKPKINRNMTFDQRQTMIKKEIMDESINLCDDDIELIDDEYDDTAGQNLDLTIASELADTSVIDEFFGEDTLMKEFKMENDCQPTSSRHQFDEGYDIITCPICLEKMTRTVMAEHLNGCTGIAIKILPPRKAMKKLSAISKEARPKRQTRPSRKSTKDILRNAGYSDDVLERIASASSMEEDDDELEFLQRAGIKRSPNSKKSTSATTTKVDLNSSSEDENTRLYRQRSIYKTTRQCPVCAREVEESEMNDHLDECLGK